MSAAPARDALAGVLRRALADIAEAVPAAPAAMDGTTESWWTLDPLPRSTRNA
jgi:hypothetical protein